jgi:hypothetical protein
MQTRYHCLLFIVLTTIVAWGSAQDNRKTTLLGKVIDDSTRVPVVGANVFLANTTLGASADSNGTYLIRNVPPGTYDLVASCIGYKVAKTKVIVPSREPLNIDINLSQSELRLDVVEVTATRSEEWKNNLKVFTKLLLGSAPVASRCLIVNPEVVHFSSGMVGELRASAEKEIVIDNRAFGYRLHVFLRTFLFDGRSLTLEYITRFEEQKSPDASSESERAENRDDAYFGSVRHFFRSLISDELSKEGYAMFTIESLNELRKSSPRLEVKRNEVLDRSGSDEWLVKFPNYLVASYDRKQVELEPGQSYGDINSFRNRSVVGRQFRAQLGIIILTKGSLALDVQAHVLDRLGLRVLGDWGKDGLANELPLDFQPKSRR